MHAMPTDAPPRPLVVRCGALGDMVLLTPLLRLLQARYGGTVDLVSSGGWTAPLLSGDPAIGEIVLLKSRRRPYWFDPSQRALVRWLRARPPGPVYFCDVTPQTRRLLARAGIPDTDIVERPDDAADQSTPWPDRWLAMAQRDPARDWGGRDVDPAPFRIPRLVVPDDSQAELPAWRAANGLDGPVVLFQPGNKRTHKRGRVMTASHPKHWPAERWAAVARAVWDDMPDARVVLCGSPMEFEVLEEIHAAAGHDPRMVNGGRDLPIPRLLALTAAAHSMVSVDTGPAHAAAALRCPLVVLFGNAPMGKWMPLGEGPIVALGSARGAESTVSDIPADAVVAAWREATASR